MKRAIRACWKDSRALLAACLLPIALSACERPDSAPAGKAVAVPTTITALIWAPDWPEEMLRIAAEFGKRNPDVRVDVQFMIGNSVEENIKPRIAAGNLPDLMSINPNGYAADLADQGVLVDLGRTAAWTNMLDSLKGGWTTHDNKRFGIAGGVATTLMYYNQEIFAKAGITQLPTDFDEFIAVCAQLRRAGFTPIMWNGGFPNMLGNGPFSFGFANNVAARQPAWPTKIAAGTLNLDTPEAADIFSKILLIAERGYAQRGYMDTGYDEGIRLFTDGKVAMAFHGSWASGLLMHGKDFQTGVFVPPWNAPGRAVVPVVGSETGFAVCDTRNKAAALRFLEFVAGEGFPILQNKRQNIAPFKQAAGTVASDPQITAYIRAVSASPVTVGPYYSFLPANTIELLHSLMRQVLLKKITPAQAARMLDASIRNEAKMHYK